jgi:hypothetical protein
MNANVHDWLDTDVDNLHAKRTNLNYFFIDFVYIVRVD